MPPCRLDDLSEPEKLFILACRRTLPGAVAGPCVDLAWRLGCGDPLGGSSARAFAAMAAVLSARSRRPLALQAPHAPVLAMDERSLLELVAACQGGCPTLAVALARWLVRPPAHVSLLGHAAALARVMADAGLALRSPHAFRIDRLLLGPVVA